MKLGERQLGLVTSKQVGDLGLSKPQVHRMVARKELVIVRRHVYRMAGVPRSWEQAVLAAALGAGPDANISHTTAAALWNLRHSDRDRAGIHITCQRRIQIEGVVAHRIRLTQVERDVLRGIPVTTAERTIIDLAGTLSVTQLGQCLDDAIRRRLVALERLRRLVEDAAPRRGRRRLEPLHKILAERVPGYRPDDSDFETEMNRVWHRLKLPPAQRQYAVSIDGHNYRLDRAIVECKIGTEWDSYRHHSSPSDRDYDSNRRARLVGDGWLIIPVTANSKPELIARAVLRAYKDRGGSGGPGA